MWKFKKNSAIQTFSKEFHQTVKNLYYGNSFLIHEKRWIVFSIWKKLTAKIMLLEFCKNKAFFNIGKK